MSAMEMAEGSMSRMEENKSEEKMAQDSILQQLFDRISSPPISELLGKLKLDERFLNTLKINLLNLDVILHDAESKAYEQKEVERWLDDVKEVGYDLEDLLDEIATARLCHQLESRVWDIETWLQISIVPSIPSRLEKMNSRITHLQRNKEVLGFSEASRMIREPYPLSAAKDRTEDECQVCGREEDKNAIIELLLSDNQTDDPVNVIPIVGVDGVGKTTLSRCVYNDYRVTEHFDLKSWVSVSDHFSLYHCLTKAFSEASSTEDSRNIEVKLNKILNMKKFLLILDDVPDMAYRFWEDIHNYFFAGAKGSKILLTARPSLRMHTPKWVLPSYDLKPLNSDGRWMLFVKHALGDKEIGLHPGLEAIGKNIVTKCNGLPLLIVTLGSMLRFKPSIEEWEAVLRKLSDLDMKKDMIPILQMSYVALPPNLKRCIAYCKLFPKYHKYEKEKLVRLWMAEDFLQHSNHRRIEEVGHMYFDDLTSRSFFQKSGENSSRFVMHSLMHELVQSVSGDICFRWDQYSSNLQFGKVRHLSYYRFLDFNVSYPRLARTLLSYNLPPLSNFSGVRSSVFERMKMIRVLSLSYDRIIELPNSFRYLKLLRYLDLSHTKISRLPDFVTSLYNLQTLLLSCCGSLVELPTKLMKLVYLRHLDIRETSLKAMPVQLGSLTSLQNLSDFIVGAFSGSNIRELGSLSNLQGTLCISQLQNVTSAGDASEANLKDKTDLQVLELKWSDATANSQHATNVLGKLEPHQNLEKLGIISYNGISFPDWVGDSSFSKMVFLHLSESNSCSHLPPLGQLPSLKELIIEGMRRIKTIGPEFFGVNNVSAKPFPSLEILVFQEMPEWEGWIASEVQPVEFPRLKRMCIRSCPKYENRLSLSAEVEISVTEETLSEQPFIDKKQLHNLHEGDSVQVKGKEKLQGRPSTVEISVTEETLPEQAFIDKKQLHKGDRVQVRGKAKLQGKGKVKLHLKPPTARPAKSEFHLEEYETNLSITSNRPVPGSYRRLIEHEKRNYLYKENMSQVSILQNLFDEICSPQFSEFFGQLKLDAGLLNNLKINLKAILDDAESKAYKDEEVKEWFDHLKAVSHDLKDLLVKIAVKRVRHKLESKRWNIKTWVQRIMFTNERDPNIRNGLEEINSRLTRLLHKGVRLTEGSSAKHGGASENSSPAFEIPSGTDTDDPMNDEGIKVQFTRNEKLLDTSGTPEELLLRESNVVPRTDVSMTSYSPPPESRKHSVEDSSAKHGGASENSSAATGIPSNTDTHDPINDDGDMVQLRRNEKQLDRPPTSRPPEESELPDSNVVKRTDVSITSNSPPQESSQRLTEDSSAKHGWASDNSLAAVEILSDTDYRKDNQEDISRPEKESLSANNGEASNNLVAIETSSDTDYSEDSEEDISSPEQESMNISQISQLEDLPPMLYSLEIEACDALECLPADLNMLNNLHHLYLIDCHLLKSIQSSHLPEALKSLYIHKCKEVEFLFTAEKHKFLENLCIESSCDSLESFPLAIFPQLRSLSIWDCINFNSLMIAEDHMFLNALEIRDCAQFISFPEEELRIPNLTSMLFSNCKNLKVLPGQLNGLTSLQSLFINECPEAESVPEGGLPSSLNLVCISFCHKLTPRIGWGLHKLNDFSRIEIEDGSKELESFPEQNLLPRNLISLRISRLSNLRVLDYKGLQHLTSLETLKISSCNKLHSLPEEGLPSSLSYLYISDCPLLNSELQNRRGKEWFKMAHIPHIQIDGKVIS